MNYVFPVIQLVRPVVLMQFVSPVTLHSSDTKMVTTVSVWMDITKTHLFSVSNVISPVNNA